jgi:membrane protease YdiL (CAAX protease family)
MCEEAAAAGHSAGFRKHETPFRRALRNRREPFRTWPTIGTIALGLVAALFGSLLPMLAYWVVTKLVSGWSGSAWSPLGNVRDPSSAIRLFAELLGYVALASVVVLRLPKLARRSLHDLGLRRVGIRDALAVTVLTVSNACLWLGLPYYYRALAAPHHVQAGFEHFAIRTPLEAITAFATTVIAGPFAEELFFRGLIFNALARRSGILAAALASGLLFGLAHGDAILLPVLALQGVLSGLAYHRTGSLWVPIGAHAFNNVAAFAAFMVPLQR